ncbi:fumarylacetoacetate hydrolase family protein [Dokdonella sp.]|uniref:fumarylacetoacetate hydrolase family protein n=1 Tax=Dokdonella sp. TaxID=2291710 RepID=UPI003527F67C
MTFAIAPHAIPGIPVAGTDMRFPVHRIYCIGRNYADHAAEMCSAVERVNPIFFNKPADAIVINNGDVPYPPATKELHHEVEMIVALATGGRDIAVADALDHVYAYGVGLDLTRRDLQSIAKAKGNPWDTAKGFDCSAPVSDLHRVSEIGHPGNSRLVLKVNGELRQKTETDMMIFSVAEIIHLLSGLFELQSGDLIYTGTPAGVALLERGDRYHAELEGVATLEGHVI